MEAVPRLPMLSFELKVSTENVSFGPQVKQYIMSFYNEDPESYNTEINNLEALRNAAVRPTVDVSGCQLLKKYYCQLHFLKSRFPMTESGAAAVFFAWKDVYSNMPCGVPDIRFELMSILYNIGALHSQLGALDTRTSPDGMKMACTHFQCAAWAFQTVKENYFQMVTYTSSIEVVHFMQQVCLAQAQECILEKSMMDNRKATIIGKVAVQVVDYYKRALLLLQMSGEDTSFADLVGSRTFKEWVKYLSFKVSYHKCIALLFQGQQAEEQQKMGERVAFYQAACEQLEEARKLTSNLKQQKEINEALAFTSDVVEGKRKAAKNENEFIYHEEVPEKHALQEVKGASLVKGIPFNVNDIEVSGPDIFARLVPMEAHEASSLYSEKKAQMLRQLGELVETKDQSLAEFMSSLQLDVFNQMRQATGLSQDLVDRAAALSAKPTATQELITTMGKLSNSYHEVESMLNDIQLMLKEEEQSEKEYQELMGKRPPSIIATDLSREAAKYREAHNKANDSNQNLHKAMTTHVANLKILTQPLQELQLQIPAVELPNPNVDENCIKEIETLLAKVEEMRNQRAMLWTQFREAVHKDDITSALVTRQPDQTLDKLFQKELQKHQQLANIIEQNAAAQENILEAFVEAYARSSSTRHYLQDIITKRNMTVTALIASFDSYEDLLAKANKGIEFYNKLETNVSKLFQRIKSACKVQQEEREQMLTKNTVVPKEEVSSSTAPKLKDYLDTRKKVSKTFGETSQQQFSYLPTMPQGMPDSWPPAVRPTPVGSEVNSDSGLSKTAEKSINVIYPYEQYPHNSLRYDSIKSEGGQQYPGYGNYDPNLDQNLADRISQLRAKPDTYTPPNYYSQYSYPQENSCNYSAAVPTTAATYNYPTVVPTTGATYSNYAAVPTTASSYSNYSGVVPTTASSYSNYSGVVPTAASSYSNYPGAVPTTASSYSNYPGVVPTIPATYNYPAVAPTTASNYSNYAAVVPTTASTYSNYSGVVPATLATYNNFPGVVSATPVTYSNYQAVAPATVANLTYCKAFTNTTDSYQTISSVTQYPLTSTTDTKYYSNQQLNYSSYPAPTESNYNQVSYNYPSNYSNSNEPNIQSYAYPGNFGTSEYTTSVQPNVSTNYSSTYSSPVPDMSSSTVSNYVAGQTAPFENYQQYSNTVYGQYGCYYDSANQQYSTPSYSGASTSYGGPAVAPTPSQVQSVQPTPPVTTKESNLDLLTGLDFTVNQAPLIPQQNPSVITSESKSSPLKPEVSAKTVKDPPVVEEPLPVQPAKIVNFKPFGNSEMKKLFVSEIEKFEKFVDVLGNKTLSGPTNLDLKWKEIQDKQDGEKKVISVARCYPMKNRFPDILPYDYSRVELRGTKDDYINASYVKDICYYSPNYIVTQAPLPSTYGDFWTMIKEQQVEIVVCLLSDVELGNDIYWPITKNQSLNIAGMSLSLVNETVRPHWTERLISITEKRDSRVIMHLQFTAWPGSLFPTNPDAFVNFTMQVALLYQQQRNVCHPMAVHCAAGIGRSGLFCLLTSSILEVTNNSNGVPDLVSFTLELSAWRKNVLRDREHLKFAYEAFLCFMKQVILLGVAKKDLGEIGTSRSEEKIAAAEVKADDPLSSLDPFWASKKGN